MANGLVSAETKGRKMAGLWRRCFWLCSLALPAVILSGVLALISESSAEAAFLKNGVRSKSGRIQTIRPPSPGSRNRLRSIDERKRSPSSKGPARVSRKQQHSWFWNEYSVSIAAGSAGRWNKALETMRKRRASGNGIAPTETVAAIDLAHRRHIIGPARASRLSEALIVGVIAVESRGKTQAKSPKGAQGLMQLIPATARRFNVKDAYDPSQNIAGGAAYLDWLLKEFNGDVLLALAGYNAGEGAVRKHKGVPPYAETRDYVVKVLDAVVAASEGCVDPLLTPRTRCRRPGTSPAG